MLEFLWKSNSADIGNLIDSNVSCAKYKVGNFQVIWQKSSLSLSNLEGKIVWKTVENRAFFGLGQCQEQIKHHYFGFQVKYPEFDICSNSQSVDAIEMLDGDIVQIRGRVFFHQSTNKDATAYTLTIKPVIDSTQRVQFSLQVPESNYNRILLRCATERHEKIFGFGQQFPIHGIGMKGKKIPILVSEQGVGRGLEPLTTMLNWFKEYAGGTEHSTYAPMPIYLTSSNTGFLLESREVSVFDLTVNTQVDIQVMAQNSVDFQIVNGDKPLHLIQGVTEYTGRMPLLPEWISNGAVVGTQGGKEFVDDLHEKLTKDADVPVAAYWLQDWVGNRAAPWGIALWWTWNANETKYPNWNGFVENMKSKDVRVLSYINSYVADLSQEKVSVQRDLFQEMVEDDMAVRDEQGNVLYSYMQAGMFDLSNPKTQLWVKSIIKEQLLAGGVSGYMCDYGEGLPLNANIHSGSAAEFHNKYPEVWSRLNLEAVQEAGMEKEAVFFMRTAYLTSPRYTPLFWLGDQMQSWDEYDGLRNAVLATTVGGLTGIAITHADIGGYNCIDYSWLPFYKYIRSKELFFRGCEFASMSSVFRTHDGTNKEKSWQLYSDKETIQFFERMSKVYVAWKFYRLQLFQEASSFGHPVVRHMYLEYPNDLNTFSLKYQYMVGSSLLFAPVVYPSSRSVQVYLPEGQWVHIWTQELYHGPEWHTIPAPFGQPCILYPKSNSIGEQFYQNLKFKNL